MKNIIDYLKDKIYYVLGITVLIIIILIVISSCSSSSGGGSYSDIEDEMKKAAKNYYSERKNKLPKTNNGVVKVNLSTLIDAELMDEVIDPNDSETKCTGYVEVTKLDKNYVYSPFLTCKGNYEPMYLTDKIKKSKQDEYGYGVYEMDGEYVYRGQIVENYVSFNDKLWRIIKIDSDGDIKLMLEEKPEIDYHWDSTYNSNEKEKVGTTTNYLNTDIRKILKSYYDEMFKSNDKNIQKKLIENKSKVVSKTLCVGRYKVDKGNYKYEGENYSKEKECEITKENEYIGLLNVSDYTIASTDKNCTKVFSKECNNYNYLNDTQISTWTLNSASDDTYNVFYINKGISYTQAINSKPINPVIYLSGKVITNKGTGAKSNPYKLK